LGDEPHPALEDQEKLNRCVEELYAIIREVSRRRSLSDPSLCLLVWWNLGDKFSVAKYTRNAPLDELIEVAERELRAEVASKLNRRRRGPVMAC